MSTDYDSWAELYDEVYSYVDYDIAFYLQKYKELGGKVLEIGCGTGSCLLYTSPSPRD